MRLTSLEIAGFKSFGKKSTLEFDAPITAVVGPNGSGKSNVAESFRFVLGEQSMKNMRGKRGEDLIFNGTTASGRQNKARVKVTLDNSDKSLDIDFDEVSIERVVHRDGVNDYFINGSSVRLKDVTELLAGANIGSSGHHIISQGEADRILNASPKDRRAMLEDALGLRTFQIRKTESEKKLEKTKTHMREVELQRKEIAPHLRFLKKQVEKVERAKELQSQLTDSYQQYLAREHAYIAREKQDITTALTPLEQQLVGIEQQIAETKSAIDAYRAESAQGKEQEIVDSLKQKECTIQDERSRVLREVGGLEGEIRSLERMMQRDDSPQSADDRMIAVTELKDVRESLQLISVSMDIASVLEIIQGIKSKLDNLIVTDTATQEDSTHFKKELAELQERHTNLLEKVTAIEAQELEIKAQIEKAQLAMQQSQSSSINKERELFSFEQQHTKLMQDKERLESRSRRVAVRQSDVDEEMREAVVLVGREAVHYEIVSLTDDERVALSPESQESRRRDLEKMKIRLEELGGGGSHEITKEYEEVSERDMFLATELSDLAVATDKLESLIKELDEEITNRFMEGVQAINEKFTTFFGLMFGGGEASLKKTVITKRGEELAEDEEDEIGVDIDISLPRKKVKGLMMLSGGERALTSIALIFAMSAVNPPPFIILDETDAALDEANSKKYGDMVENLAQHSQLILITHNRETMSRASMIYGVTMIQGVSELLSIKFEEGVQFAK